MYFLVVFLLVSLQEFDKISSMTDGDICETNFPKNDSNCSSFNVSINEECSINTDNGNIIVSQVGNNNTGRKVPLNYTSNAIVTTFTVCKHVLILGKLELRGKKVISIQSCHGDIFINSTQRVDVFCTDAHTRTSCTGLDNDFPCSPSNDGIGIGIGGGGGGAGGVAVVPLPKCHTAPNNLSCNANRIRDIGKTHDAYKNPGDKSKLKPGKLGCQKTDFQTKRPVTIAGGGAIKLKALCGNITIGSVIDASGRDSCIKQCKPGGLGGGGGGGTIRLFANEIYFIGNGKLIADGGDGGNGSLSGGGGGGGIIHIVANRSFNFDIANVTSLKGGNGTCPGFNGTILNRIGITTNYSCKSQVQENSIYLEMKAKAEKANNVLNDTNTESKLVDILLKIAKFAASLTEVKKTMNFTIDLTKLYIEVINADVIIAKAIFKRIKKYVEIPFENITEINGCRPKCNVAVFTAIIKGTGIHIDKTKEDKHDLILASDILVVEVLINGKPLKDLKDKRAVIKIPNFHKEVLRKREQEFKKEPIHLYLDAATKLWSSRDVNYSSMDGNTVSCSTGHFTSFAVFFVKDEQSSEEHKLALDIISYIGCALSLVGIIITLALYVSLRKEAPILSEDRNIVHINLMISLGLVQVAFLSAVTATPNTLGCKIVALILHYLFVVSFIWMFIEGIVLYLKVIKAFNEENVRMKKFIVLGWVFPAIFVAVFATLKLDEYTKWDRCFLSADLSGTIWALLGPAAFSVTINIGIFIAVLRVLFRFGTDHKHVHKEKILIALRSFVILTPILGFTWAFALVVMNHQDDVFWQYAYCLCNSFQGFMIFLIFGIGNSEIRAVLKRKLFPRDKWDDFKPVHKKKCSYDNEVEMDERPTRVDT